MSDLPTSSSLIPLGDIYCIPSTKDGARWTSKGILSEYRLICVCCQVDHSHESCHRDKRILRLTREFVVDPPVTGQQSIELTIAVYHLPGIGISIQAETANCAKNAFDGDFLCFVGMRSYKERRPIILVIWWQLPLHIDVDVGTKANDDILVLICCGKA